MTKKYTFNPCSRETVDLLKSWVRDELKLEDDSVVLVSECSESQKEIQTVIMVVRPAESGSRKEEVKFFRIQKSPALITKNDIAPMLQCKKPFDVKPIGLAAKKTMVV
jgi:hypothetical protein